MTDDPALDMLARHAPGHLPDDLFHAIARLVVTPTWVIVPVLRDARGVRVCLTRRAADDPQYPGLLHPPGTVILASDADLNATHARLWRREFHGFRALAGPVFVAPMFARIPRGAEIALIHYQQVAPPRGAETFDAATLPADVIDTDIPRIRQAVEMFTGKT